MAIDGKTFANRPWQALYPFESRWMPSHGAEMHYIDEGPRRGDDAGSTLLFVHGNPTWSFHWRRLVLSLRDTHRCVAADHLGCGLSDLQPQPLRLADHIDNLVRLVASLDLSQVTLVAQDWGGAIGLGAVLADPARFERLVLLNTGAFRPWYIPWRIRACRMPVFGRWAVQGLNAFSRAALSMTLARRRLDPATQAAYLDPYASWSQRAAVYQFVRDIPGSPRHPTWTTLAAIESRLPELAPMPSLLVWGARDWCFTTACLDRFAAVWPAARICRIEDAGHWVVEDAPNEVERAITEFLQATEQPAPGGTVSTIG